MPDFSSLNRSINSIGRQTPRFGFLVLSVLVIFLHIFVLFEAWVLHSLGGLLVALTIIGIIVALALEARAGLREMDHEIPLRRVLEYIAAHAAGAWLTYTLSHRFGLGPVVASAFTGLVGGVVFPRFAAAIYCGSFVGMCSTDILAGLPDLLLASIIAGIIFSFSEKVLCGFGGKLGTIAFTGALLTGLGLNRQFVIIPVPPFPLSVIVVLCAAGSAVLAYCLSTSLKFGPISASALTGLAGGILLPALFPQNGQILAIVAICASFTGMSSRERFANIRLVLAAGLITGLIFLYSLPVFGGAGGKLGTIAFGASLTIWGYKAIFERWQKTGQMEY